MTPTEARELDRRVLTALGWTEYRDSDFWEREGEGILNPRPASDIGHCFRHVVTAMEARGWSYSLTNERIPFPSPGPGARAVFRKRERTGIITLRLADGHSPSEALCRAALAALESEKGDGDAL